MALYQVKQRLTTMTTYVVSAGDAKEAEEIFEEYRLGEAASHPGVAADMGLRPEPDHQAALRRRVFLVRMEYEEVWGEKPLMEIQLLRTDDDAPGT